MRKIVMSLLVALASTVGLGVLSPAAHAASTGLTDPQTGRIVSEEPSSLAPNILDGTVYSMTKVGSWIVVGGSFTQAENYNSSTVLTRNHVLAFDATTGKISTTFVPEPNGTVFKVQTAGDGTSVFLGGHFSSVAGVAMKYLTRLDLATGAVTTGFKPSNFDGDIRDIEVVGSRLWVGGKFTHIGGTAQKALGTVTALKGVYDPYFTGVLAGLHNTNSGAVTDVLQLSTDAANTELVAVGNFTSVDGQSRSQIVKLDIGGPAYAVSPWSTTLFTSPCSSAFDTYMTDAEFSPDGSYFVVSTTGAYGGYSGANAGTTGCDGVFRFENSADAGARPTWTAYTGGDTTWTVEVTDKVVYTGGHMRWQNNAPTKGDTAGQGAVERTGIAALNPVNGMPYSWNPTRARGVGVQDLLATGDGLYVGSDTTLIGRTAGNTYHARVAMLPLAGGKTLPSISSNNLPADVYTVASGQSQLVRRAFTGSSVTSSSAVTPAGTSQPSPTWNTSVGAFVVNGTLYSATNDGTLSKRSFSGTSYGTASTVSTGDGLVAQTDWHSGDVPSLTSLFYFNGRIYFTKAGQNTLYYRGFETEDDLVGQQRLAATSSATPAISWSQVRGAFVADGKLYYADTLGRLFRVDFTRTGPTGPSTQVSGTGVDAQNWTSRAMFVYPNAAPTASFTLSCNGPTCKVDATGSADPDGSIASYDWSWGDGPAHDSGVTATHTYAAGGSDDVTLTVTDNRGSTGVVTHTASPTSTGSQISYVGASSAVASSTNATTPIKVTVPAGVQANDELVLILSAAATQQTYDVPAGWTPVASPTSTSLSDRVWVRPAVDGDAGTTVGVTTGASNAIKTNLAILAYRGVDTANPVSVSASQADNTAVTSHTSPTVQAPDGTGWVVSYWADKASSGTGWSDSGGQTLRTGSGSTATGSGHVDSVVADSNGAVDAGTRGGFTATSSIAAQALSLTLVLKSL
jgi:hypothetical protein